MGRSPGRHNRPPGGAPVRAGVLLVSLWCPFHSFLALARRESYGHKNSSKSLMQNEHTEWRIWCIELHRITQKRT